MSAEGRERVRQAQIKRWAALKGTSKANLNTHGCAAVKAKEEGRKGCLMSEALATSEIQSVLAEPAVSMDDRRARSGC